MKAMNMKQQASMNNSSDAVCIYDEPLKIGGGNLAGGRMNSGTAQHGSFNSTNQLLNSIADGSLILSADAAAGLVYMIEEEKMARDLYDAFADQTGSLVFDKISDSEQIHYDTLLLAAEKAGIELTGISTTAGVFTNTAIQSLYDSLYAQGSESLTAAIQVGIAVENTDIADLSSYSADSSLGIVGTIYSNLTSGSEHHLTAFTRQAEMLV